MAKEYHINFAMVRGAAMVQAGMMFKDRARAVRVFDKVADMLQAPPDQIPDGLTRFDHDIGVTMIPIREVVTFAMIEHDPNPPPAGFPDVQMPGPAQVPS